MHIRDDPFSIAPQICIGLLAIAPVNSAARMILHEKRLLTVEREGVHERELIRIPAKAGHCLNLILRLLEHRICFSKAFLMRARDAGAR